MTVAVGEIVKSHQIVRQRRSRAVSQIRPIFAYFCEIQANCEIRSVSERAR
jgi:hypothetical protein